MSHGLLSRSAQVFLGDPGPVAQWTEQEPSKLEAARSSRAGAAPKFDRREYMRQYQRRWMADRRAHALEDKSCVLCGGGDRLEFDHVDRNEKVTHRVWSWSAVRRAAELAKCQILCHGCHLERTRGQFVKPLVHGTSNAYDKKECRCAECRGWNAARVARCRAARLSVALVPAVIS